MSGLGEPPEWAVACPKCKALPGWPCQSIRHEGGLTSGVYRVHKKRRTALILGPRVLGPSSAPCGDAV